MLKVYTSIRPDRIEINVRTPSQPEFHTTWRGFSSIEEATAAAEDVKRKLLSGELTVDDIRKFRPVLGRRVTEWAAHFNVTRNALYKAARNKKITVEEEILRRLPLHERERLKQEFS